MKTSNADTDMIIKYLSSVCVSLKSAHDLLDIKAADLAFIQKYHISNDMRCSAYLDSIDGFIDKINCNYEDVLTAVDRLADPQKEIIKLHYFFGKNYIQIADKTFYSVSRITQLHMIAINDLVTMIPRPDFVARCLSHRQQAPTECTGRAKPPLHE